MKPYSHKRYTLLASVLLVVGGLVLACFLWVRVEQRQYAMNRQLIESLREGDVKRALNLVKAGADPNTRVVPDPTPTWQELLQQMLHRSSLPTNNSPTALMVACGDREPVWLDSVKEKTVVFPRKRLHDPELLPLAQVMLLHGANINTRDETESTALMWASYWNLTDRMTLLLKHGALIDLHDTSGRAALHFAVEENHPKTVKLLLNYHANPNLKDFFDRTPMSIARIDIKSPEIIRLLKAAGATE